MHPSVNEGIDPVRPFQCRNVLQHLSFLFAFTLFPFGQVWAAERETGQGQTQQVGSKEIMMEDAGKLSQEDGKQLLSVARQTIEEKLFQRKPSHPAKRVEPAVFSERRGTFVTLTTEGALRGCIGHIVAQESLIEGVKINAINAAFRDPRFKPVGTGEWEKVKIEVSILTDPAPLSYSDAGDLRRKLRPGVDGVILKKGFRQATFLPQVWEQLPEVEEFLMHLCLKAGLDGSAWKKEKLEVLTYQAQAFHEE
jgi:AmmeMemoRadiSam system protein A